MSNLINNNFDHKHIIDNVKSFISKETVEGPTLFIDLSIVKEKYNKFSRAFPYAKIHYAVKCNPEPEIIKFLGELGSSFDAASIEEIELCLSSGITVDKICFGSTIKKSSSIKIAFDYGVRTFAFDSLNELKKIAEKAPGSNVYCRLLIEDKSARLPLDSKFGCSVDKTVELMKEANLLGLNPYGVSFHTGSQQINLNSFEEAVKLSYQAVSKLKNEGISVKLINMGGGFPAYGYNHEDEIVPSIQDYRDCIETSFLKYYEENIENYEIFFEPGRYLVADAGVIKTEVVLVSEKETDSWLYIDCGVWNGLNEALDEMFRFHFHSIKDNSFTNSKEYIVAGHSCDSIDVIYKKKKVKLVDNLEEGDILLIESTGAYSTTLSSINFNGFKPMRTIVLK